MTNIPSQPAHTDDEGEPKALVSDQKISLGKRSRLLVARGLSDLAALSNWRVRECFSDNRSWLCVSRTGKVATHSATERADVEIYDIEKAGACLTRRMRVSAEEFVWEGLGWSPNGQNLLVAPATQDGESHELWLLSLQKETSLQFVSRALEFGWSPDGQNLLVATATQDGEPHALLLRSIQKETSFQIAPNADLNAVISWSARGNYAAVSSMFSQAPLRLWRVVNGTAQYVAALQFKSSSEYLLGCRSVAFDKQERRVSVVAEVGSTAPNVLAHWDEIFLLNVPDLRIVRRIGAPDSVFGLSWSASQDHLVLKCPYGRTYSLDIESGESTLLPFPTALCLHHPTEDICAFVEMRHGLAAPDSESELVKRKITIAKLSDLSILSEYVIENATEVLDACWSVDGNRFYAVSGSGQSYVYTVHGSP